MILGFGKVKIDSEVIENTADEIAGMAIRKIAKAVPEESLCITIIGEILEKAKKNVQTMPITSFQQYLEGYKK